MTFNIVDTVKSIFTDEAVAKAANVLGEPEANISKAVSGIVPAILGGLAAKASSGTHEGASVLEMAKDTAGSSFLGNLGNSIGGNGPLLKSGLEMAKNIFSDKLANLTGAIASYAGIKASSASSLLSMATPAALGVIGEHALQNNINAGSLTHMLLS